MVVKAFSCCAYRIEDEIPFPCTLLRVGRIRIFISRCTLWGVTTDDDTDDGAVIIKDLLFAYVIVKREEAVDLLDYD